MIDKKTKLIKTAFILIIFLFGISFLDKMVMIRLGTDEMSPLSVAAYFTGLDWRSLLRMSGYYSYGYSIIIYPLVCILRNPQLLYQGIIVLDSIFLCFIFIISLEFAKKLKSELSEIQLMLICFVVTLYPANVLRTHYAISVQSEF